MAINNSGINKLLNINSASTLNSRQEYKESLMKKLQLGVSENDKAKNAFIDCKQTIVELMSVNKQTQLDQYVKTTRKLKEDQFKNDVASAKSPRKRAKIRSEHVTYLVNASMGKILLAKENVLVDENLKEAEKMGIEAAEVEIKRKKDEMEAEAQGDNGKNDAAKVVSVGAKKEKKKSLNMLV